MNPLTFLKLYAGANPEKVQRMATIAIFLLFVLLVFGTGYWMGKMRESAKCERAVSQQRIEGLEALTETYAMLMGLEKKHAADMANVEKSLNSLDRQISKTIDSILKTSPELARWYREPINDVERAAMYADFERMLNEASIGLSNDSFKPAATNRMAAPRR